MPSFNLTFYFLIKLIVYQAAVATILKDDAQSSVFRKRFTFQASYEILPVTFSWNLAGMVLRWCRPSVFQVLHLKKECFSCWSENQDGRHLEKRISKFFSSSVNAIYMTLGRNDMELQPTKWCYLLDRLEIQHGGHLETHCAILPKYNYYHLNYSSDLLYAFLGYPRWPAWRSIL